MGFQGFNITMGDGIYIGPNCTILDVCPGKPLQTSQTYS